MDLSKFEIDSEYQPERHRSPYFLGPTNLGWLAAASRLPGRGLHLAVVLKLQWDLNGRAAFRMQSQLSARFSIDRYAERRALKQLEAAGLIRTVRRRGARPRVELISSEVGADMAPPSPV